MGTHPWSTYQKGSTTHLQEGSLQTRLIMSTVTLSIEDPKTCFLNILQRWNGERFLRSVVIRFSGKQQKPGSNQLFITIPQFGMSFTYPNLREMSEPSSSGGGPELQLQTLAAESGDDRGTSSRAPALSDSPKTSRCPSEYNSTCSASSRRLRLAHIIVSSSTFEEDNDIIKIEPRVQIRRTDPGGRI